MATNNSSKRLKAQALTEDGTLNSAPQKVSDPKFQEGEFFDPRDIVQVKYEMLRRVLAENVSVTDAAEEYGVSRPTYYQTKANLHERGIAGLVPKKRGPRRRRKLDGDILAFIEKQIVQGEPIRARQLSIWIQQKFKIKVHPRSIERVLAVKKTSQ